MSTNKKTSKSIAKIHKSAVVMVKNASKEGKKLTIQSKNKSKTEKSKVGKVLSKVSASASKKVIKTKKITTVPKSIKPQKISTPQKKSAPISKSPKLLPLKSPAPQKTLTKVKPKSAPEKAPIKQSKVSTADVKTLPRAKDIKVPHPKQLVLPKITATKSRKYEPEFTRSVLDQPIPQANVPSQRYSDSELNEFRELIQRKLETAKKELGYLQGLITRKDEMGGDDTDNRYMTMEDGSLSMEREQLSQMASRQITFIDHLEKAMMRIENKTYGICRVTGKLIDKARLRAVPHATLSIEAKMGIVK